MKWKVKIIHRKYPNLGDAKDKRIFLWLPFYNDSDECYYWLQHVNMRYNYHFKSFLPGMGWRKWRVLSE